MQRRRRGKKREEGKSERKETGFQSTLTKHALQLQDFLLKTSPAKTSTSSPLYYKHIKVDS